VRGESTDESQERFALHLHLPGQVFDAETGLHYKRQRYHDPQAGQYLTLDPLRTPDGPNPYAYVAFNPLTNIDPDGLVLFAFDGPPCVPAPQPTPRPWTRVAGWSCTYNTRVA